MYIDSDHLKSFKISMPVNVPVQHSQHHTEILLNTVYKDFLETKLILVNRLLYREK